MKKCTAGVLAEHVSGENVIVGNMDGWMSSSTSQMKMDLSVTCDSSYFSTCRVTLEGDAGAVGSGP